MHILDQIVDKKRSEVAEAKALYPVKLLERSPYFSSPTVSLKRYLSRKDKAGIIAEIKRRSPSKGLLNPSVSVRDLSIGYMQAGASALSVLTDASFFGGSAEDLKIARRYNLCPILRKDFMIDEYQVTEARSIGADVILLIARILEPQQTRELAKAAHALGLEVLLEVHNADELGTHLCDEVDVVGVNNRNLDTFEVDLGISFDLASKIPDRFVKISESGISDAANIRKLRAAGYGGFLIGETFMKTPRPEEACAALIESLQADRSGD